MVDTNISENLENDLTQRAWQAYLQQELLTPAQALLDYANSLCQLLQSHAEAELQTLGTRILDRSQLLLQMIQDVFSGQINLQQEVTQRTFRHDLRGAVGYIISASEELLECIQPEDMPIYESDLTHTRNTAKVVLTHVETVANFHQNQGLETPNDQAMRASLAKLSAEVLQSSVNSKLIEPGRILLVDDNEYSRDLLTRNLRTLGHLVEPVESGLDAQKRLQEPFLPYIDLILCDVLMPNMSGLELLRWIKSDPKLWPIPTIMISALGEDDSVLACIAAGSEDYLTRPVKPQLLQARISGSLEKKRLRDREQMYQARIDKLVHAIFPEAVIDEWRQNERIRPRRYEKIGVLFLDVVGFTQWCEVRRNDPEAIVTTLQDLVTRFEQVAERHDVQKIKTIGDAFMAVAGLAEGDTNPAQRLLKCGLELIEQTRKHPAGWGVRVGIHVGPVVTGVLGERQFSFDVWGHTVNAAARMESNGRVNCVTLSEEAWNDVAEVAEGVCREAVVKGIGTIQVWDVLAMKS